MKKTTLIIISLLLCASGYTQSHFLYRDNGKYGLKDSMGNFVITPKYTDAFYFSEGLANVKLDNKWGYIDSIGNVVIPHIYNFAGKFSEGLALVKLGDYISYIDKAGEIVLSLKYFEGGHFSEGLAWVRLRSGVNGYIDKTGKEVIPPKYGDTGNFSEGLAWVKINGRHGYIDKTGKEVIPPKYPYPVGDFSEGLAMVNDKANKLYNNVIVESKIIYGYIDKTGKEVIPFMKYDNIYKFSEGLAIVELNKRNGFVDKTGKEVLPPKYDFISPFAGGLARAKNDGKEGYIDKSGEEVIPVKYNHIGTFSEGLVLARLEKKYGYFDKLGNEVIPLKYDDADNFSEGLAFIQSDGKYGYIDKTGNVIIPMEYIDAEKFIHGKAKVKLKNGLGCYIDKTGLPLEYDYNSPEMKIIYTSPLTSYLEQIMDKYNRNTILSHKYKRFNIEQPYLIIESQWNKSVKDWEKLSFIFNDYSEDNFNEQSVENLKTLIVRYDYVSHTDIYNTTSKDNASTANSYATVLFYFDLSKKECIGFDKIPGPVLPRTIGGNEEFINTNSFEKINEMIKSHLAVFGANRNDKKNKR